MKILYDIKKYIVSCDAPLRTIFGRNLQYRSKIVLSVTEFGVLEGVITIGDIMKWLIKNETASIDTPIHCVSNKNSLFIEDKKDYEKINLYLSKVTYLPIVDEYKRPIAIATNNSNNKEIQIDNYTISKKDPTFIIAEIGNNHNGSLDLAKKLLDAAKEAGADCAKFQLRDMSSLFINTSEAKDASENLGAQYTLDLLRRFQLTVDEMFAAFDHCKNIGMIPLCTPWDIVSASHLQEYGLPAYKIASADLTNHELLSFLVGHGKPLLCSTGMSYENEIQQAVKLFQKSGVGYALLHCNSTYPAPFKDINLNYLHRLSEIGDCLVGYSGHERDIFVSVGAVAKGAKIIEKHFTLDRNMEGNDHKVSLLLDEFKKMVEGVRQVEQALGTDGQRALTQGEMMNRVTLAKSIYASTDIPEGTLIQKNMLEVKSPGKGIQPNMLPALIGLPAPHRFTAGDVFYPTDLEVHRAQPRDYHFSTRWGFPVRHHDYRKLLTVSNPDLLEFHLSYKDLDLDHKTFFPAKIDKYLVVHAPELFFGDHTLDLTSPNEMYRKHSICEMKRVIDTARTLLSCFNSDQKKVGLITNVGGFSLDAPLSAKEIQHRRDILHDSLKQLQNGVVEIWPQTMPPFPWHFGGQRFHNMIMMPDEIVDFCLQEKMRVCLDVSHSKLACTHAGISFQNFLEKVLPYTAHLHIADAAGVDGEGLRIGEGDMDFYALSSLIKQYAPQATWIPEVWQGHENNGEGFWNALEELEKAGF